MGSFLAGSGLYVDGLEVRPPGVPPVPLPSSALLGLGLLSALGMWTGLRRRKRAKLLSSAARKRRPSEALALMDEAGFVSHEALHKPLVKLLKHDASTVAIRAAELLGISRFTLQRKLEKYGIDAPD